MVDSSGGRRYLAELGGTLKPKLRSAPGACDGMLAAGPL